MKEKGFGVQFPDFIIFDKGNKPKVILIKFSFIISLRNNTGIHFHKTKKNQTFFLLPFDETVPQSVFFVGKNKMKQNHWKGQINFKLFLS